MRRWKSDPLVVLRARESRVHGEAAGQSARPGRGNIPSTIRGRIRVTTPTGRDSDQSQGRLEVPLHLVGAHSDAGVSERNVAADEPAGSKRSGWRDMRAVRARSGDTGHRSLGAAQSRAVPGSTGAAGGHPQTWGHVGDAPARHPHGGRPVTAARGGADSQRHLRAGLHGVLVRIPARTQPASGVPRASRHG